jgi:hypothetical protein
VLDDTIADYVELKMAAPGQLITGAMVCASPVDSPARKLLKVIGMSDAMAGRDEALVRQLRRKCM